MIANETAYSLSNRLPAEAGGTHHGLASYRNYPVFGLQWLLRRTMIAAPVAIASGLLNVFTSSDWRVSIAAGAYSAAAFLVMTTSGPVLATGVRYLHYGAALERGMVAAAILLGFALSFGFNLVSWEATARLTSTGFTPEQRDALERLGDILRIHGTPEELRAVFAFLFLIPTYFFLGGGLAARAYYSELARWTAGRRSRELASLRTQKSEADMRLTVLQAQVEPHFLFNTLASVRSLIRHEPAHAETTVDALVDYLRVTIPRLRANSTELDPDLGDQLDICASYLHLMQVRMGDRLSFDIDAARDLRAQPFPPLMLISLVENAIKHGIEQKPGPGKVTIRAAKISDNGSVRLQVSVADDGLGLASGMGTGVGLANIRDQLKARYGDRARLDLRNQPAGGAIATISVPV